MKGFIVAMLLTGVALFLAALLWPERTASVEARQRPARTVTASAAPRELPVVRERESVSMSPPQPATPAMNNQPMEVVTAARSTDLRTTVTEPVVKKNSNPAADLELTSYEELTFKQTGTDDTSLRNADFPRTYISKIHVDLASPNHSVTLTWAGPNARMQPTGAYHSSPGRGLGNNDCDDPAESCRVNSNCTPKGTFHVQAFSNSMVSSPECRYVTWFDTSRGIALHFYPNVPNYPASHGCVRLNTYAAHLIHNNSKIGETEVTIEGKWTFGR